ncbi:MAG: hypothetical protein KY453_12680 [Gemmatimonadetes bacterium]|nr:hypothetical protein [Gemmatimonadota bacterium]
MRCTAAAPWIVAAVVATGLAVQDAPAQTSGLPTVAVLDFTGLMVGEGGNSAPLGKAVASMLITELSDREGMQVIERTRLQDILTEQRLSLSGRVSENTALEVGQMLGAQYVVYGQVTSIAGMLRMDLHAIDVETSEILEAQKLSGRTDELLDVVMRIADLFAGELELAPPSERPAMEPIPVRATIEFSRAVDFEDRGDRQKAIEHYQRTLEIHPEHRDARRALERLQTGGGG